MWRVGHEKATKAGYHAKMKDEFDIWQDTGYKKPVHPTVLILEGYSEKKHHSCRVKPVTLSI